MPAAGAGSLLELNHRRYEEEQVAAKVIDGEADKGKKTRGKKGKKSGGNEGTSAGQMGLL